MKRVLNFMRNPKLAHILVNSAVTVKDDNTLNSPTSNLIRLDVANEDEIK